MGIRVHKQIGYGLDDVKYEKYDLVDPRFDPKGILFAEGEHGYTAKGFLDFCAKAAKEAEGDDDHPAHMLSMGWLKERIEEAKWDVDDSVGWGAEYEMGNVLHVVVPGCKDHKRYDDIMDYYEEQGDGSTCRATFLDRPIYPWEGYMDSRTGKGLRSGMIGQLVWQHRAIKDGKLKGNVAKARRSIKQAMDDETLEPEHCVPALPPEVVLLCKYVRMFKDEASIFSLRPMIYVYWG